MKKLWLFLKKVFSDNLVKPSFRQSFVTVTSSNAHMLGTNVKSLDIRGDDDDDYDDG